jgi:VIT1/CCC1 family predicted Fe2+/Mn2+ transporter
MDRQTAQLMGDEAARAGLAAHEFDREWVAGHLATERRHAGLLGEIREIVFGAQDGLVSTLAVVSLVAGATPDRLPILIAGIASALAGVFSMAAGEYTSSKSQREIFEAQIAGERLEVAERPGEAEAEVTFMLEEEGLPRDDAVRVARIMAGHPEVMLKTMVEKELGLAVEEGHGHGSPFQGAVIMGVAFGIGAVVPLLPYILLPVNGGATVASFAATAAVLFAIGMVKSRWTQRNWFHSGIEILLLGAFAGLAGFFFGNVLPGLLGARSV